MLLNKYCLFYTLIVILNLGLCVGYVEPWRVAGHSVDVNIQAVRYTADTEKTPELRQVNGLAKRPRIPAFSQKQYKEPGVSP